MPEALVTELDNNLLTYLFIYLSKFILFIYLFIFIYLFVCCLLSLENGGTGNGYRTIDAHQKRLLY